jgi:hypothetical protein
MPRPSRPRSAWTPRRRRGAAIQLILGGLLLMGVPLFFGDSGIASGFRAMSPIAWLMTVAGAVLLLFQREAKTRLHEPSGLVPLHPEPVRPTRVLAKPIVRPQGDPLDPYIDTESMPDDISPSR